MKILTAQQIKLLESATIQSQNITEVDLVKRAGQALFRAISSKLRYHSEFAIFCGTGKNGSDGLYCAKLLSEMGHKCRVFVVKLSKNPNPIFMRLLDQIDQTLLPVEFINSTTNFPKIRTNVIIVDSLIGTGLTRPLKGVVSDVCERINTYKKNIVVSIDLPTGLSSEGNITSPHTVNANYTFTLGTPKLSLMLSENYKYVGEWKLTPIGLDSRYIKKIESNYEYVDKSLAKVLAKNLHRQKFSHKGIYGHSLVIAGGKGKMGAAVLATKSALRSGTGLVTALVPDSDEQIIQISAPEAMTEVFMGDQLEVVNLDLNKYKSILVGPGIGTSQKTSTAIRKLLKIITLPLVIDADAINIISTDRALLEDLPKNSIITPHVKEFDRLVGKSDNSTQRLEKQRTFANRYNQIVILKGAHTSICVPNGPTFFNSTGNPGMSTAGSGDVLAGSITALLAQGLNSAESAILGVYIHGLAGDIVKRNIGVIGMNAQDIIQNLPKAINSLI